MQLGRRGDDAGDDRRLVASLRAVDRDEFVGVVEIVFCEGAEQSGPDFSTLQPDISAELTGDAGWAALRPPLVALDGAARRAWLADVVRSEVAADRDAAGPY